MSETTTLENPIPAENETPRRRGRPRTHGLAARDLHIAEEDRFAFAEFSMYQMECLDPRDDIELFYCRQIVAQRWFLIHADQAEAARMRRVVQTLRACPLTDPDNPLKYLPRTDPQRDDDAMAQAAADNQTQLLLRYHTTHLRSMLRLEKALKDYRKDKADRPLRADTKNYDNSPDRRSAVADPVIEAMKAAGVSYAPRPDPAPKEPARDPRENYDNSPAADSQSEPVPQGAVARDSRRETDNHPENHPDHKSNNGRLLRPNNKNCDNSPAAVAPEVAAEFEQTKKIAALLGFPVADVKTAQELTDICAVGPQYNPSDSQPLHKNYNKSPDSLTLFENLAADEEKRLAEKEAQLKAEEARLDAELAGLS